MKHGVAAQRLYGHGLPYINEVVCNLDCAV